MQKNLIRYLRTIFTFISQLQKSKHDKYLKTVKKCLKLNLNPFTERSLFIQHHERKWEENIERMVVDGILKETVVSRPQRWECAML